MYNDDTFVTPKQLYHQLDKKTRGSTKMRQNRQSVSPMSNEGRNLYVVTHITETFLELIKEKPLSDISIGELCDKAGVGRASFYRNFESKEDVIAKYLKCLLDDWSLEYEASGKQNFVESIFTHYYKHKDICITLYRQGLAHLSLQSIVSACGPKPEQENIVAYTTAYLAYGLYGWIEEWFKRGMKESPTEMAALWAEAQKVTQ